MLHNYFKIAIRKIRNYPWNTANRVLGLTIGLTACFFISSYVWHESSYDQFHSKSDNIYRIMSQNADERSVIWPAVMFPHLKGAIAGVEQISLLTEFGNEVTMTVDNTPYMEEGFYMVDPEILDIFDIVPANGTIIDKERFAAPFSILISESIANKYFPDKEPVGEIVKFQNAHDFTVVGVFEDWRETSHISPQFFSSSSSMPTIDNYKATNWYNRGCLGYVLLSPGASVAEVSETIGKLTKEANPDFFDENTVFTLQPLADVYLHSSDIVWNLVTKGDIQYVRIIFITGLLILLIACFNTVNLSVAQTMEKTSLFGMMKTFGSFPRHNRRLIFCESFIIVFLSMILTIVLIAASMPLFRSLTSFNVSAPSPFATIVMSVFILIIMTFLTGAYPAFVFGRIPAISILKKESLKVRGSGIHKILVTAQFAISIALMTGIFIIINQIKMMTEEKLGFDKEHLLIVNNREGDMMGRYELFKTRLESNAGIKSIGMANNVPSRNINNWGMFQKSGDSEQKYYAGVVFTAKGFLPTIDAEFVSGEDFSGTTQGLNLVVTESFAESAGETSESIIGKQFSMNYTNYLLTVVGVVEDLQYHSLHKESNRSSVAFWDIAWYPAHFVIRLTDGDWRGTLASIESVWNEIAPEWPFSFQFMDERLQSSYKKEISMAKTLSVFAVIAILLSCMGVLGITTFIVNHRTKEIGIRKVNGAKIVEIMSMLNFGFVKWILIAFAIATPVIWFVMNRWLENFAFKTDLSWWIFALSGMIVLAIAMFTISWQSWRAARRNPVEALRYE